MPVPAEAPPGSVNPAPGDAEGRPPVVSARLRWQALLAGLGWGVLGFALDGFRQDAAAPAGVWLSLAGGCVFLAVLTQGRVPGLLAALVAFSRGFSWEASPFYVLRVLEALGASLLLERTGSLVLSVTLYWLGLGAWLALAVWRVAGDPGAGALVGQLLSGLLNAWLAELLVRLTPARALESRQPRGIRRFLVGSAVRGVALPGVLLAVIGLRVAAGEGPRGLDVPAAALVLALLLLAVVVSGASVGLAGHRLAGALERVVRATRRVVSGDVTGGSTFGDLDAEPIREVRQVGSQFAQMHEALAYYDPLTGLPNRKLLLDRLGLAAAQALPLRQGFALLLADLDRFRVVDAALGRGLSNVLLGRIAQRLRSCVRAGDTVARVGGDEFGLLIPAMGSMEAASQMALKVMDSIKAPFLLEGREVVVTASIGISLFPRDGQDAETLLSNATAATYLAKEQGQDSYRRYTARITARDARRLQVESGLRRALEQGDLVVHYQPILDLRTGEIQRMEALVRWQRPDVGLVGPLEFIPVAESSGLIVAIDTFVLRDACARVKAWSERGHRCGVAVNLSARQLQRPELADELVQTLRSAQIDPEMLEIEITEGTALQDVERTVQTLSQLRAQGVSVAVDDFGTGYSSLSYLKKLPLDWVKLDQSFVRDLTRSPDDAAIATAVIAMAHSLKLLVVAEGVETDEQLAFLRRLGCDSMQGYLFSRAVPVAEADRLLDEGRRLALEESA